MELDDFLEEVGGKPLTDTERALMVEMRKMVERYSPRRVPVVGDSFDRATAIGNLIHSDFNKLEEKLVANMLKGREDNQHLEDVIILGTSYNQVWFDEYDDMIKIRDVPVCEVYDFARPEHPADHPTRKREPKGPRGKWGALK